MTPSEQRQNYIEIATQEMQELFERQGQPLPEKLRVSIGFNSLGKRAIGACYHSTASGDDHREVFISPVLSSNEDILATLAHELCHAALPDGVGHGKPFKELAYGIGLTGKATSTVAGPAFQWWIANFVREHGDYPAAAVNPGKRQGKQPTAMLKCECEACGYIVRTTRKWLDDIGAPHCPLHGEMMVCD